MITFYAPGDPHGCFSNFSRHRVHVYDRFWPTSEHAFQAMKFHPHRPDLVALVHQAPTPGQAARLGRERSYPLRPDWDCDSGEMLLRIEGACKPLTKGAFYHQDDGVNRMGVTAEPVLQRVKDVIMYEVVFSKFYRNEGLQQELLGTGDEVLVEDAVHDPYWGWGASHVGENKLGRILMAVRAALRGGLREGYPAVLDVAHDPLPERGSMT